MTGDPDADEHTDKEDEEDDDDEDNNNSLSGRAAGSDSDDSYYSESSSMPASHSLDTRASSSNSHNHSIGDILGISCPSHISVQSTSMEQRVTQSSNSSNESSTISTNPKPAIHVT